MQTLAHGPLAIGLVRETALLATTAVWLVAGGLFHIAGARVSERPAPAGRAHG